jgi:hypothetical protein
MSELRERPPSTERVPTRVPGEGGISLESTAGDAQLEFPSGLKKALDMEGEKEQRPEGVGLEDEGGKELHGPHDDVPASGVYNVVDRDGYYLDHQITCHRGSKFPPATHEELLKKAGVGSYFYELAYEAVHLTLGERPPPHPARIYRPGESVPISGVYNVVDGDGNYLFHQRAWVEGHDEFGPTGDPQAYGYVLAYAAKHLHPE